MLSACLGSDPKSFGGWEDRQQELHERVLAHVAQKHRQVKLLESSQVTKLARNSGIDPELEAKLRRALRSRSSRESRSVTESQCLAEFVVRRGETDSHVTGKRPAVIDNDGDMESFEFELSESSEAFASFESEGVKDSLNENLKMTLVQDKIVSRNTFTETRRIQSAERIPLQSSDESVDHSVKEHPNSCVPQNSPQRINLVEIIHEHNLEPNETPIMIIVPQPEMSAKPIFSDSIPLAIDSTPPKSLECTRETIEIDHYKTDANAIRSVEPKNSTGESGVASGISPDVAKARGFPTGLLEDFQRGAIQVQGLLKGSLKSIWRSRSGSPISRQMEVPPKRSNLMSLMSPDLHKSHSRNSQSSELTPIMKRNSAHTQYLRRYARRLINSSEVTNERTFK